MTAETRIKREARARLQNQNWSKAIAITIIVLCVPLVQALCNEFLAYLFHINWNTAGMSWNQVSNLILRRASNWPYFLLFSLSGLLFWLLSTALTLGMVRWNLRASQGLSPAVNELFYYFSSGKLFLRAVSCGIQLTLRLILWLVVCFGPGVALALFCSLGSNLAYSTVQSASIWAVIGNLASVVLICAGITCFVLLALRYFAAQTAVAALEHKRVNECISLSIRRMKGKKGSAFLLILSFLGWGILCFFVLPLLFVVPYFRMSVVTCSKWILIEEIKEEYEQTRQEANRVSVEQ